MGNGAGAGQERGMSEAGAGKEKEQDRGRRRAGAGRSRSRIEEGAKAGKAMLSWGSDQIVNVYVPRACNKKNLKSIPPIILVLGHILLVFGHF